MGDAVASISESAPKPSTRRQDSYKDAVESISESAPRPPTKRQDSYKGAVASISESVPTKVKADSKEKTGGKGGKRQRSYQLAVGETVSDISASSISTEVSAK